MRVLKLYIDTSVIGGCFDEEFSFWSNRIMQDIKEGVFHPVLSEIVDSEIMDAPERIKEKYKELISTDHTMLMIDNSTHELAKEYVSRKIISQNFYEDALHIALSTIHNIDILISWNFKHIVHYDKIKRFNAVNLEFGYKYIDIYSPMEVAGNDERNE